jgi:hypothetical protein
VWEVQHEAAGRQMFGLCVDLKGFYIKASAALRLACPRVEYSDAKVANRLGLARGDIKWSLNEGQRPRSRGVRKIPDVTIRNFLIAEGLASLRSMSTSDSRMLDVLLVFASIYHHNHRRPRSQWLPPAASPPSALPPRKPSPREASVWEISDDNGAEATVTHTRLTFAHTERASLRRTREPRSGCCTWRHRVSFFRAPGVR